MIRSFQQTGTGSGIVQKRLNEKSQKTSSKWVKWALLLLLLFLLLFFFFLYWNGHKQGLQKTVKIPIADTTSSVTEIPDTTVEDSVKIPDSVDVDSQSNRIDTLEKIKPRKKAVIPAKVDTVVKQDSLKRDTVDVSSADSSDPVLSVVDRCAEDTATLWVYPDPSGGLHRKAVSVSMVANKECNIFYRFAGDQQWIEYQGSEIAVSSTSTLQFKATDSCGHQMEMREEYYEIEVLSKESPCLPGMELVSIGGSKFCIDRYEWPNQKGVIPKSYISLYQAMDSCYSVGKRLCTSEEWMLACSGPHTWSYPYGQEYERYACATHDQKVSVSGSRPECRSFFGAYDMSGSLLEWTSTKATANRQFYYVMGGFWESGPQSGCSEKRYSYFPENQHNPVGFRCCSDIPDQSGDDLKKVQKGSKR